MKEEEERGKYGGIWENKNCGQKDSTRGEEENKRRMDLSTEENFKEDKKTFGRE